MRVSEVKKLILPELETCLTMNKDQKCNWGSCSSCGAPEVLTVMATGDRKLAYEADSAEKAIEIINEHFEGRL